MIAAITPGGSASSTSTATPATNAKAEKNATRPVTQLDAAQDQFASPFPAPRATPGGPDKLGAQAADELAAARAEAEQLAEREAHLAAQQSSADVHDAVLAAMSELRSAIASALASADGIERVRALLRAIFPAITVRRVGDDFHLDPGEPGDLAALLERSATPSPTIERLGLTTL